MLIRPAHIPGSAGTQPPIAGDLPIAGYAIQHVYPHDPTSFTQGLQYVDGVLYEGTGLNGRSSIRKVKLETGEVLQQRDVPSAYFGEGIVVWQRELIELTWQSEVAFVYDRDTFEPRRTFTYHGEGWGLTQRRHEPDHERRHRGTARARPDDIHGTAAHPGNGRRRAASRTSTSWKS